MAMTLERLAELHDVVCELLDASMPDDDGEVALDEEEIAMWFHENQLGTPSECDAMAKEYAERINETMAYIESQIPPEHR